MKSVNQSKAPGGSRYTKAGRPDRRRPPDAYKYKPGQSGNPKGRRKGSKNTNTMLREILNRKIEMRVGGVVKRIKIIEAVLTRCVEDALKGNIKSAAFILNRFDGLNNNQEPDLTSHERDQEIIEAYAKRFLKAKKEGKHR